LNDEIKKLENEIDNLTNKHKDVVLKLNEEYDTLETEKEDIEKKN